jgi:hypothetical protein
MTERDVLSFIRQDAAVPDTDPEAIRNFEKEFGIQLPRNYIDFLLKRNGGHPKKPLFRRGAASSYIEYFLPLTDADRPNLAEYANRASPYLKIAKAGGGDDIYIKLETGAIFKRIHDNPVFKGKNAARSERDFVLLAETIQEFIGGLTAD